MTILFLPVSLYRVRFQVATGRPFSRFERLVLKAIDTGSTSLGSLVDLFRVHRRMVVESLVTLMQAGWVSLGSDNEEFTLTSAGAIACKEQKTLPPVLFTEDRSQVVVMERVAGQVARSDKVRFATRKSLSKVWHLGTRVPKSDISNTVEPGMVRQLLSHRSGERVRWVGPITTASDSNAFVVVGVDLGVESIIGIPQGWMALLRDELLECAYRREHHLIGTDHYVEEQDIQDLVGAIQIELPEENQDVVINTDEFGCSAGCADNHSYLARVLQFSQSLVCIASSRLDVETVATVQPLLEEALSRGKSVYIAWGYESDGGTASTRDALKLLEKLQWDSKHDPTRGKLVVGSAEGQFNCNILVGDIEGSFEAAVGSYSWLGGGEFDQKAGISVLLKHSAIVSRLCDVVGDYHESDPRLRRASGLTRLRNAAVELSVPGGIKRDLDPKGLRVSLVFDRHNIEEAKSILLSAAEVVIAGVGGDEAEFEISKVLKESFERNDGLRVRIQRCNKSSVATPALDDIVPPRLRVETTEEGFGNILVADSSFMLLTSLPLLAVAKKSQRTLGSEIGIRVTGDIRSTGIHDIKLLFRE